MCALVIVEPMFKLVPKDAPKSAQQKYPKHQKLGFASKKMFGKKSKKYYPTWLLNGNFTVVHSVKNHPKNGHNTNFRVPNPQVRVTSSNPTGIIFFGGETLTTIKKYYGSSGCWWFPP